jgi:hypothetical protein
MPSALRVLLVTIALGALMGPAGCNPGAQGVGDPYTSSGAGGEGSGPTGTQGDDPASNPAADTPTPNSPDSK